MVLLIVTIAMLMMVTAWLPVPQIVPVPQVTSRARIIVTTGTRSPVVITVTMHGIRTHQPNRYNRYDSWNPDSCGSYRL
jgi:hypothetical protein